MVNKIIAFPVKAQEDQPKKKKRRGERADGLIQRSWQYIRLDNGERDRVYFYGRSGAEADRKKEAFIKAYNEEKEALEKKKKELEELGPMAEYLGVTVSVWLDAWKAKYKTFKSIITETAYDTAIKRIKRHIGEMKLEDVRDIHIQPIFREIEEKSKATISKTHRTLRQAFSKARKNKIIRDNPMDDFELPDGADDGTHRELEAWECDFIIKQWRVHRSFRWALTMILSGMRIGEMAAIDPEDIHLDTQAINIDDSISFGKNQPIRKGTTKTEAGVRSVPICDLLYEVFEYSLSQVSEGPLFRMKNGKPITKVGIRRAFETLNRYMGKQAEASKNNYIAIRPHDCRHTYATALYDAGLFEKDLKYVQYLLGHKNIQTTLQLYTHLTRQRMRKGFGTVVSLLNKWVTEIPPHKIE